MEFLRENALAYWVSMVSRTQCGAYLVTVTPGAGKTTTFNMLTGDTRPSSGTATIAGHDITSDIREVCIMAYHVYNNYMLSMMSLGAASYWILSTGELLSEPINPDPYYTNT